MRRITPPATAGPSEDGLPQLLPEQPDLLADMARTVDSTVPGDPSMRLGYADDKHSVCARPIFANNSALSFWAVKRPPPRSERQERQP